MRTCPKCEGSGKLIQLPPVGLDRYAPYGFGKKPITCYICDGKGELPN